MSERIVSLGLLTGLFLCCIGCGGDGGYRVSGKVTFKGQPVPAGKIYFMPDGTKGNNGPTGFADIKDGKYDTGLTGRGAPAGAVLLAIEGIDPSKAPPKASPDVTATVLFPRYELAAELPASVSTKDIDVPDSAAKGPTSSKKEGGHITP